jgi:hypothetical protein
LFPITGVRHGTPGALDEKSIEAGDTACPRSCAPLIDQIVVEHTRRWISSFVIGLGLCPFARQVFDAGLVWESGKSRELPWNCWHLSVQLILALYPFIGQF